MVINNQLWLVLVVAFRSSACVNLSAFCACQYFEIFNVVLHAFVTVITAACYRGSFGCIPVADEVPRRPSRRRSALETSLRPHPLQSGALDLFSSWRESMLSFICYCICLYTIWFYHFHAQFEHVTTMTYTKFVIKWILVQLTEKISVWWAPWLEKLILRIKWSCPLLRWNTMFGLKIVEEKQVRYQISPFGWIQIVGTIRCFVIITKLCIFTE